ncbi:MAG: hypothetical protein ACE5JD_10795 [Candidatus Methylomirabilia bacterium]
MPVWASEFQMPFVMFVFPGWALCLFGGLLLLVAAIFWSARGDGVRLQLKPRWWRGAVAVGVISFILGAVWQLAGYVQIGAVFWPQ